MTDAPRKVRLSVVMPAFDESERIGRAVERVRAVDLSDLGVGVEVVVVDDGSRDGTRVAAEALGAAVDRLVVHERNRGKGAAIRSGLAAVTGEVVVVHDADLEYDPQDFRRMLAPLLDGRADVVYGSRFRGGEAGRVLYFWHYLGNRFLTTLSNMFTDLNLTDMETCAKMFRRSALDGVELRQDRFGFEPELTAKLARRRLRFYEVGVGYDGRTYAEGKKVTWRDGLAALWCIVRYGLAD